MSSIKRLLQICNLISLASTADGEKQLQPAGNSEHENLDSHSGEISQAKRQPVTKIIWNTCSHERKHLSSQEKKKFQHLYLLNWVGLAPKSKVSGVCSVTAVKKCRAEYKHSHPSSLLITFSFPTLLSNAVHVSNLVFLLELSSLQLTN